jgi:hypothetical protein
VFSVRQTGDGEVAIGRFDMTAKGRLFEYAVLHHPKAKRDLAGNEDTVKSVIITDVTRVLAASPDEVSILAARSIPEEYLDKIEQVEIVVRPF